MTNEVSKRRAEATTDKVQFPPSVCLSVFLAGVRSVLLFPLPFSIAAHPLAACRLLSRLSLSRFLDRFPFPIPIMIWPLLFAAAKLVAIERRTAGHQF